MRVFSWDAFFTCIGIDNPASVTNADWTRALNGPEFRMAKIFFHTAYAVAQNFREGNTAVSWHEIEALHLEHSASSSYFSQHSGELREQMISFGARLLCCGNENQYIRTLSYYSGAAQVKVIQAISEYLGERSCTLADYALQYHSPEEVRANLKAITESVGQQCLRGFPSDEERNSVVEDIVETFVSILDLYRECLTNFTEEDLLEVCRLPVPRPAAAKIAELFGRVVTERIQIGRDQDGQGVFRFPLRTPLLTSDVTRTNEPCDALWIRIARSRNGDDSEEWLTYRREENSWASDHTGTFSVRDGYVEVPIVDVTAISRIPVFGDEKTPCGAMDIRPRVCDGSYILLVEHADRQAIYLPGRKLTANDVCHVLLTSSLRTPSVTIRDENGEVRRIEGTEINHISLEGDGLEALIIDGDEFPIAASSENDWQNTEKRFKYLHQAGCRAYPAEVCPVVLEKLPAAESISYSVGNSRVVLRQREAGGWTPWRKVRPELLWQRGTLEVNGRETVLKSARIIFTDVDFGDFAEPSQVDAELNPGTIVYVGRDGVQVSPDTGYTHGNSLIQFEVDDLKVRRAIDRIGVFFITPDGRSISIVPESEDMRRATPIALTDILNLTCKVVVPCNDGCEYSILLTRGNECVELNHLAQEKIRENGHTTFHWRDYAKKFSDQNKDSKFFSVCIRAEDNGQLWIYKFRGIDPIETVYPTRENIPRHTVRHSFENDGSLKIWHCAAYSEMVCERNRGGIPTSFICCPIDRLDAEDGFVELKCTSRYLQPRENCAVTSLATEVVTVPRFREVFGQSLRNGCVCFLSKKQQYVNAEGSEHRLISSGFFVCDGAPIALPESNDVLSRLRYALSVKDEKVIQEILSSEDEQIQGQIRGVLDRVRANIANINAPGVRDYLNLYRCVIRGVDGKPVERSGYAFLAYWYDFGQLAATHHGVSRHLAADYRKYWPWLMFPFQESVSQGINVVDVLGGNLFTSKCKEMSHSDRMGLNLFLRFYDAVNKRINFESNPDDHGPSGTWTCGKSLGKCYYGQYFEYCCDSKIHINWNEHCRVIENKPKLARAIMRAKQYLHYQGLDHSHLKMRTNNILCGLRKREIRDYLIDVSVALAAWRKEPSLDANAQQLKYELLLLEEVDDALFPRPPSDGDYPTENAPCCFTEIVAMLALRQMGRGDLQQIMQNFHNRV